MVFQNLYRLLLSEFYDKRNDIISRVKSVDKALSQQDQEKSIHFSHLYYTIDAINNTTISDIVSKYDYSEFEIAISQSHTNDIKSLKRSDNERDAINIIIDSEHCVATSDIRYFISCIDTNFRRQSISIKINYYRKSNRPLL